MSIRLLKSSPLLRIILSIPYRAILHGDALETRKLLKPIEDGKIMIFDVLGLVQVTAVISRALRS